MRELSEAAQELLERLWIAIEEEGRPGLEVRDPVGSDVDELMEAGLVKAVRGRLVLTPNGRTAAAGAIRRHRLAERLLADVFAMGDRRLEDHACRFEHALVDGAEERVCTLLGHPRVCPHGKPIPPGECCLKREETVERLIAPLSDLRPGERGTIAYIHMDRSPVLQKLLAMGMLPGTEVTLLRRFPSYVLEADRCQFAVDEEIAAAIHIRLYRGRGSAKRGRGEAGEVPPHR